MNKKSTSMERLKLSKVASEVFVRALLNPPAPGKRLVAAAKRYLHRINARYSRVSS